MTPREFAGRSVVLAAGAVMPWAGVQASGQQTLTRDWMASQEDPVRHRLTGKPNLDTILKLFPRTPSRCNPSSRCKNR